MIRVFSEVDVKILQVVRRKNNEAIASITFFESKSNFRRYSFSINCESLDPKGNFKVDGIEYVPTGGQIINDESLET